MNIVVTLGSAAGVVIGLWAIICRDYDKKPFDCDMDEFGIIFGIIMILGAVLNVLCMSPSSVSREARLAMVAASVLKILLFTCFCFYAATEEKLKKVWGYFAVLLILITVEGAIIFTAMEPFQTPAGNGQPSHGREVEFSQSARAVPATTGLVQAGPYGGYPTTTTVTTIEHTMYAARLPVPQAAYPQRQF